MNLLDRTGSGFFQLRTREFPNFAARILERYGVATTHKFSTETTKRFSKPSFLSNIQSILLILIMANQSPEVLSNLVFSTISNNNVGEMGLSALAEICPCPDNTLVGLLTAPFTHAPVPSLDDQYRMPLQPNQILAIVDDVLRELDEEANDGASEANLHSSVPATTNQ